MTLRGYLWTHLTALVLGYALAHLIDFTVPRLQRWYDGWNARLWHKLRVKRGLASDRPRQPSRQWRRQMQRDHVKELHDRVAAEDRRAVPRRGRRDGIRALTSMMRRAANPKTGPSTGSGLPE